MPLIFILLMFAVPAIAQEPMPLVLEYPTPDIEDIVLLKEGSTERVIRGESLPVLPGVSNLDIKVRMFPLLSSPYRDPYPVVQNPFEVSLSNSKGFNIYQASNNALVTTASRIDFDFAKEVLNADGNELALVDFFVEPIDGNTPSTLLWDKGQKNSEGTNVEIELQIRGRFLTTKTSYPKIHPRVRKIIDARMPPKKGEKGPRSLWSLLNVVALNEYLQSVLPSEISARWHPEALRAQAIAARTYALYEMTYAREELKRNWDVDPTTWYQSYRGVVFRKGKDNIKIEAPTTNDAVKSSRHRIVTYRGEAIKAYFSANSGGLTCSAKECFNIQSNPPYLRSVPDAEGVKEKPYGTWGDLANVTQKTIKDKLVLLGFPQKDLDIHSIQPKTIGESGRVWSLNVNLNNGTSFELNRLQSSAMLTLFGSVRSYLYTLSEPDQKGKQKVVGHGYGHGVGMSQYGTLIFSEKGYKAEQILMHYYTDTNIIQIATDDKNPYRP